MAPKAPCDDEQSDIRGSAVTPNRDFERTFERAGGAPVVPMVISSVPAVPRWCPW